MGAVVLREMQCGRGSVYVHVFGAFFGLGVSYMLPNRMQKGLYAPCIYPALSSYCP